MTKKEIKQKMLELEDKNKVDYEVSYRGGYYGLSANDFVNEFIAEKDYTISIVDYLPEKVGVYCNYLGGGLRGAIVGGGYGKELPLKIKKIIDSYTKVCKQRYLEIEGRFNDEVDEDGEINWEAKGTNACRKTGIVSAY